MPLSSVSLTYQLNLTFYYLLLASLEEGKTYWQNKALNITKSNCQKPHNYLDILRKIKLVVTINNMIKSFIQCLSPI